MGANPERAPLRPLRNPPTLGRGPTIALALALFLGIFVLRETDGNVVDADEILFVVPIAILALRFGLRGGVIGALVGLGLIVAWDVYDEDAIVSLPGYLSRGVAFLLLGTLLGMFVDRRRVLEAQIQRYFEESLDMLATADFTGRFTRVNPAWERTLGQSAEIMCSRPYIDFVHPEDREATIAETVALSEGSHQTVRFRNRYRAADGSYHWLEWSATSSPSEGVIHAVARDITVQQQAEQQLAGNAKWLETKVAERTRELEAARAETLQRLALAAEYRDDDTSQHTERVGETAARLGERLALAAEETHLLREAAPLHDVGKLAISDSILLKPGRLSEEEYEVMKTHTVLGARLLSGSRSPVLRMAAAIAATHHERWDGSGYPEGLRGEEIPLVGRIVAVADVFDALTHDRPYKAAWPTERAIAEIRRGAASQFDPAVVAAFLSLQGPESVLASDARMRAQSSARRAARAPGGRRSGMPA
jgi:putative two-component system response regulator